MTELHVQNIGSLVERSGRQVEIHEDIPPFAAVEIARAPAKKANTERDAVPVWYASKPGPEAYQRRPGELAFNGRVPIVYGGWGTVTMGGMAQATVDTSLGLPLTGDGLAARNDSWHLWPAGDQCTCAGVDPTLAREQGATVNTDGRWSGLPKVVVMQITPRTPDPIWLHGFARLHRVDREIAVGEIEGQMPRAVRYRLYQPKKPAWVFDRQRSSGKYQPQPFEPIDDGLNHLMPGDAAISEEDRLPWSTNIGWCKVREAGTYLVHFSARLSDTARQLDYPEGMSMNVGLFAAKPVQGTGHYKGYDLIEHHGQPASVITRDTRSRTILNTIPEHLRTIQLWFTNENAATAAIVELNAGWAFAFLPVPPGDRDFDVDHFSCSVVRIGPVSSRQEREATPDAEAYWQATTRKLTEDGQLHPDVAPGPE